MRGECEEIPIGLRGEQALWRAVITQALMDAASQSGKMEAQYEKSQALCWLTSYSDDFKTVCDLANYPPDYIRGRAIRALARNCRWRSGTQQPQRIMEPA